jgi:excinuclease ABC subunit C
LPAHSRALHLLQRVRDEAHRFAVSYHRSLRAKRVRESILDGVPGIGDARKQQLLKHFGNVKRMRAATIEEISGVAGLGPVLAQAVVDHLRETESS